MKAAPAPTRQELRAAALLAEFASELRLDDIPEDVCTHAKLHLLDVVGCGLAALGGNAGDSGRRVAARRGGIEEASVLGLERRAAATDAALANGILFHALDFDDTHAGAVAHISTVVCPAALAVGESVRGDGASVLAAIVAANEAVARIGMAAPGEFHARGFHPTAVCGVFGSALVAAALLGLDRERTTSAVGLAGSMAAGLFAYLEDATATKPIHAGFAAQAGVLAAQLAAEGAEGPPSVFEARLGFYRAFVGADVEALAAQLDDLGERWETSRIAYKAYPACHYMHGVLGAAASLLEDRVLSPREITGIQVAVPPGPAASLVLEPPAAKRRPRTCYEGKFSLQYSLASLLVYGSVGLETYRPNALHDPEVLAVAARIEHEIREIGDGGGSFPGAVRIRLASGEALEAELAFEPGTPENPLSSEQIEEKFLANARLALPGEEATSLLDALLGFEEQDDLSAALVPLRSARQLAPDRDEQRP